MKAEPIVVKNDITGQRAYVTWADGVHMRVTPVDSREITDSFTFEFLSGWTLESGESELDRMVSIFGNTNEK